MRQQLSALTLLLRSGTEPPIRSTHLQDLEQGSTMGHETKGDFDSRTEYEVVELETPTYPTTDKSHLDDLIEALGLQPQDKTELLYWIQAPRIRACWQGHLAEDRAWAVTTVTAVPDLAATIERAMTRLVLGEDDFGHVHRGFSVQYPSLTDLYVRFIVSVVEAHREAHSLWGGRRDTQGSCRDMFHVLRYLRREWAAYMDVMALNPETGRLDEVTAAEFGVAARGARLDLSGSAAATDKVRLQVKQTPERIRGNLPPASLTGRKTMRTSNCSKHGWSPTN
ncbi:MAG: hypothetical protein M1818_007849 [Claussenomyces sp. TS43310]|nr:MAG: hypothetical protein M1818_007849 [Claussenomyces sp. TS43310]